LSRTVLSTLTNTGSGTFGNASLAATPLRLRLRAGDANRIAKTTLPGQRFLQKRKPASTGCLFAKAMAKSLDQESARLNRYRCSVWRQVFGDDCKYVQCGSKDQYNSKQRGPHGTPPFSPITNLKTAPQMQQKYGTHLDTRVVKRAKIFGSPPPAAPMRLPRGKIPPSTRWKSPRNRRRQMHRSASPAPSSLMAARSVS
jgi:hypothetical protein